MSALNAIIRKNYKESCIQQKKIWQKNIRRKIISRHFFSKHNISSWKQISPGQVQTQDICGHRRIRYLQIKWAGDVQKKKRNHYELRHQVIQVNLLNNPKNSIFQYPDLITLANRKRKISDEKFT